MGWPRDRYFAEERTPIGLKRVATGLTQELGGLVRPIKSHTENERIAKFLENHLDEVFPFLRDPDEVNAPNNESESELREHVIARNLGGGNRSDAGVAAQETLPSIIRRCRKLILDPIADLRQSLTSTTPVPLFPTGGGQQVQVSAIEVAPPSPVATPVEYKHSPGRRSPRGSG